MFGLNPNVYMMESIWFFTFQQSLRFGTPWRKLVGLAIYSKINEISPFYSTRWSNGYVDSGEFVLYIV